MMKTSICQPFFRPRRLRKNAAIRGLVRETDLSIDHLIFPLFVTYGKKVKKPIASLLPHAQFSVDTLREEIEEISRLGIPAVLLFGIPEQKDPIGSAAYDENGIIPQAIKAIKKVNPELYVITDVCCCEYTDHGHCGPVADGEVENDATLELIAKQALVHAHAGADMVAPSGMIDGMVRTIRQSLDAAGHKETAIMSYAVKYASGFYGPFRDAAQCAPKFGNRSGYQMDPANSREALRETMLDMDEGADIIMVKPALAYLDIIKRIKEHCHLPLAAYNVSGEYAMIKAAAEKGWIDEKRIRNEVLIAIRRAGADIIITYFAKDIAKDLKNDA